MATVTRSAKARPSHPVGESRAITGTVSVDVIAGQLLVLNADGTWGISTAANPGNKRGFAALNGLAGHADVSIITTGEMEGWTGLAIGTPLYPDAAGELNTVAVTGFYGMIHAITATRIEFTL